jgi:hypothetical protein
VSDFHHGLLAAACGINGERTTKPMTVDNPKIIDFVTLGPDGAAVLVMVEHRPWDGTDERL